MSQYRFLDRKGTFLLERAENTSYLYFPIAGEKGMKSALTPSLGGDAKLGQNQFVLEPVSAENLHNNKASRNFWCLFQEQEAWSATGVSAAQKSMQFTKEQEKSSVTAGLMWHKVSRTSSRYSLRSEITSFVPLSADGVEVMLVEIFHDGEEEVSFTPIVAIPLYGRSAADIRDHRHVTSLLHQIKTTPHGVELRPTLSFDERGHQKNTTTYYVYAVTGEGEKPEAYYPITEKFIGEGGSFEHPRAVLENQEGEAAGKQWAGYEAIGGIRFPHTLMQPKESRSYIIFIGAQEDGENNAGKIEEVVQSFGTYEKIKKELESVKEYWQEKQHVEYHTSEDSFDQYMQWVSFQPMLRRIYGCSFLPHHDYGKGGRGWRDLWQDCLALLITNPEVVREMLLNNFAGVRMDGTNATIIGNALGEFVADRNQITRVWMDHGLWPLITVKLYIDQTGDLSILLKEVSYFKDKQACRGTKADEKWVRGLLQTDRKGNPYRGSIIEHLLLQHLSVFYDVGEHNHMRLRGADWNDALDMAWEKGESVAFTAAYAGNLKAMAYLIEELAKQKQITQLALAQEMGILLCDEESLYESVGRKRALLEEYCESCIHDISGEKEMFSCEKIVQSLMHKADWIQAHIRRKEWIEDNRGDAGWFNGYYDNEGRKVEGHFDDEVRMMLTGQVFTIMSKTADDVQVKKIVQSADRYLYREEVGGYRLNTDFGELKMDLGRMFGFAYGHKENGAVFSHMTTMYANALYQRGFVKEGYRALHALYRQAMDFEKSRSYPGIPEYFNESGRGMYHYLTGAASWYMLTVITQMFGVKGKLGSLSLEPKLLKEQFDKKGYAQLELTFQNRRFCVRYENPKGLEYGEYHICRVMLNGKEMPYSVKEAVISPESIQALSVEHSHEILVELGN